MRYVWLIKHIQKYPSLLKYKLRIAKKPDYCIFAVTHKCNAKCIMCNFWKNKDKNKIELTLDEIKKIFQDPLMKNLKHVSLTGGEAILRKDICSVIDVIYDNTKAKIDLGTNGLTPDRLDIILEKKKDKIAGVQISIDGLSDMHNKIRGRRGAFKLALKSLEIIKKHGIQPGINMTLSPLNYQQLYETYEDFKNETFTYKTAQESKDYFGDNLNSNLSLTYEMKQYILEQIKKMGLNNLNPYVLFLDEWILKGKRPLPCYAGITTIFINAFGDIYPCIHKSSFGNIKEQPIKKIWLSRVAKQFRKTHKNCSSCYERCTVDTFRIDILKWAIKCKLKKWKFSYLGD